MNILFGQFVNVSFCIILLNISDVQYWIVLKLHKLEYTDLVSLQKKEENLSNEDEDGTEKTIS